MRLIRTLEGHAVLTYWTSWYDTAAYPVTLLSSDGEGWTVPVWAETPYVGKRPRSPYVSPDPDEDTELMEVYEHTAQSFREVAWAAAGGEEPSVIYYSDGAVTARPRVVPDDLYEPVWDFEGRVWREGLSDPDLLEAVKAAKLEELQEEAKRRFVGPESGFTVEDRLMQMLYALYVMQKRGKPPPVAEDAEALQALFEELYELKERVMRITYDPERPLAEQVEEVRSIGFASERWS